MRPNLVTLPRSIALIAIVLGCPAILWATGSVSSTQTLNEGWRYFSGAHSSARFPETDDSMWETISLPHAGSPRGFAETARVRSPSEGVFWYRKHFTLSSSQRGQNVVLSFDGEMGPTSLWVNGHVLAECRKGRTCCEYDITRYIRFGRDAKNVISVRIQTPTSSAPGKRQASLNRKARIIVRDPIHVVSEGIEIVPLQSATDTVKVEIRTELANTLTTEAEVSLEQSIFALEGNMATCKRKKLILAPSAREQVSMVLSVDPRNRPQAHAAKFYRLETRVLKNGAPISVTYSKFPAEPDSATVANTGRSAANAADLPIESNTPESPTKKPLAP